MEIKGEIEHVTCTHHKIKINQEIEKLTASNTVTNDEMGAFVLIITKLTIYLNKLE